MTEQPVQFALASANWRKSSRTTQTECVEVAEVPGWVGVRDSKDPACPVLTFPATSWSAFLTTLVR